MRSSLLLIAVGVLLAAGCGSSKPASDGGTTDAGNPDAGPTCTPYDGGNGLQATPITWLGVGDGGVTLDGFVADYLTAYCAALPQCAPWADYLIQRCFQNAESAQPAFQPFDVASCHLSVTDAGAGLNCQETSEFVFSLTSASAAAAQAGTVIFHPDVAAACLAAPWSAGCSDQLDPTAPSVCNGVFTLAPSDAGPCYDQCGGAYCPLWAETDAGFCGRSGGWGCWNDAQCCPGSSCSDGWCRPGSAPANCDAFTSCPAGEYCTGFTRDPPGGTCQPQVGAGASCNFAPQGGSLSVSGQCMPGLVCKGLTMLADGGPVPGVCTAPAEVGGACVPADVTGCAAGLNCNCGVCVVPPSAGPCLTGDFPCRPDLAYCDLSTLTCQPLKGVGQACNPSGDTFSCTTAYCRSGTCDLFSLCP